MLRCTGAKNLFLLFYLDLSFISQLRRDRNPTQSYASSKRKKTHLFCSFLSVWFVSSNYIVCTISVTEAEAGERRCCFFFHFRGIQLRRDRNPTQYVVRTNKKKTSFLLFFSDLSSSSDYGVTVTQHSKWFDQTKKNSFLLFFSTSELYFQLRRDRNPTQ